MLINIEEPPPDLVIEGDAADSGANDWRKLHESIATTKEKLDQEFERASKAKSKWFGLIDKFVAKRVQESTIVASVEEEMSSSSHNIEAGSIDSEQEGEVQEISDGEAMSLDQSDYSKGKENTKSKQSKRTRVHNKS